MAEAPNGRGLAWLLAAKVVCCGGLLLAATGALSLGGLMTWLLDGGIAWLAIAALAIASLYLLRRRRVKPTDAAGIGAPPAKDATLKEGLGRPRRLGADNPREA